MKLALTKPIVAIISSLAINIVVSIISLAIFYGCLVVLIKIKRCEKVSPFSCIPEGLKKIWKVFVVNLWIGLKMLFWSIILTGVVLGVEYLDNLSRELYLERWNLKYEIHDIEREIDNIGDSEYRSYKFDMRMNGESYLEKNEWLKANGYEDEKIQLQSKLKDIELQIENIEKKEEKFDEIGPIVGIIALVLMLIALIMLIIQSYKYALSFFILHDNPNLSGHKIVNKSRDMMKGKKGKLFGVQLKYVLIGFLATLLFFIFMVIASVSYRYIEYYYLGFIILLSIFLNVYIQMANICFYEEIKNEEKQEEIAEVINL